MNQLEMSKAFSELEGIKLGIRGTKAYLLSYDCSRILINDPYNPITDLALNCAARDKYKVRIDYDIKEVSIWERTSAWFVSFTDCPCQAVIECIIKSYGLWED